VQPQHQLLDQVQGKMLGMGHHQEPLSPLKFSRVDSQDLRQQVGGSVCICVCVCVCVCERERERERENHRQQSFSLGCSNTIVRLC